MTVPLERRLEVPCSRCGYHYRKTEMEYVLPPLYQLASPIFKTKNRYECRDEKRCAANRASRDRLDAWKRGQR